MFLNYFEAFPLFFYAVLILNRVVIYIQGAGKKQKKLEISQGATIAALNVKMKALELERDLALEALRAAEFADATTKLAIWAAGRKALEIQRDTALEAVAARRAQAILDTAPPHLPLSGARGGLPQSEAEDEDVPPPLIDDSDSDSEDEQPPPRRPQAAGPSQGIASLKNMATIQALIMERDLARTELETVEADKRQAELERDAAKQLALDGAARRALELAKDPVLVDSKAVEADEHQAEIMALTIERDRAWEAVKAAEAAQHQAERETKELALRTFTAEAAKRQAEQKIKGLARRTSSTLLLSKRNKTMVDAVAVVRAGQIDGLGHEGCDPTQSASKSADCSSACTTNAFSSVPTVTSTAVEQNVSNRHHHRRRTRSAFPIISAFRI